MTDQPAGASEMARPSALARLRALVEPLHVDGSCPWCRGDRPCALLELLGEQSRKPGTWPQVCVQRAFVEGMEWWQFHHCGATAFPSERDEAEAEAVERYGEPLSRGGYVTVPREVAEEAIAALERATRIAKHTDDGPLMYEALAALRGSVQ